jgi:hypothetical protein
MPRAKARKLRKRRPKRRGSRGQRLSYVGRLSRDILTDAHIRRPLYR